MVLYLKCYSRWLCKQKYQNIKDILPWSISKMTLKTFPISPRIVKSCAMTRDIAFLSLKGTQWKLNQQNDQNFSTEGNLWKLSSTKKPCHLIFEILTSKGKVLLLLKKLGVINNNASASTLAVQENISHPDRQENLFCFNVSQKP